MDERVEGWFDGGSRGNPGIAGAGWLLRGADKRLVDAGYEFTWRTPKTDDDLEPADYPFLPREEEPEEEPGEELDEDEERGAKRRKVDPDQEEEEELTLEEKRAQVAEACKVSNNTAEYFGMLRLIQCAAANGVRALHVRGDSKLAIMQVTRKWKCDNHPHLRLLRDACWRAARAIPGGVTYEHVKRAFNKEADRLSNDAMSRLDRQNGARLLPK